MKGEVESEKIIVGTIFTNMWFRIPEYQRPYVWGKDEIYDLLEDISVALLNHEDGEIESRYFLGSFVCQEKTSESTIDNSTVKFTESDLLDGQQRMITLFLLFIVLRILSKDDKAIKECEDFIFQEGNLYKEIPNSYRVNFDINDDAQNFLENLFKEKHFCEKTSELKDIAKKNKDTSVKNMANSILCISNFFKEREDISPDKFMRFISNKVDLIKVSTQDFNDAFLLFTILNNRGIPLRGSDILKSQNLSEISNPKERERHARKWEEMENALGADFDRFLGHIRTILVKEKAKKSLLEEFGNKIYNAKKPPITKGEKTFNFINNHFDNYRKMIFDRNIESDNNYDFDNLIYVLQNGYARSEWIPPLLCYYDKFPKDGLLSFLKLLDKKISADWIMQKTPTSIMVNMCAIIREIETAKNYKEVLKSKHLIFETDDLLAAFQEDVYGKRHASYLLLKLNYLCGTSDNYTIHKKISIEHILPQNPAPKSQWVKDFTQSQREQWKHKIGNLILINRTKNSSLSNFDYDEKKKKYFGKHIDVHPHSNAVLNANSEWKFKNLEDNHNKYIEMLKEYYEIK